MVVRPSAVTTAGAPGVRLAISLRCTACSPGLLEELEYGRFGLAAALAHGRQAVRDAVGPHVVHQRRHQAGAAPAKRVTQRDRAAAWIEAIRIRSGLDQPGERDRREGLVDLEGTDIALRQPAVRQLPRRGGVPIR